MQSTTTRVTSILKDLQNGDRRAASRLLPLVYRELRRLAAHYMRAEKPGQTIQPTELVHEAFLRLVGQEHIQWQGKTHFFALAATSMRRILVERARKKMAHKHGGGVVRMQLDEGAVFAAEKAEEIVALDEALLRLEKMSPRQSRIVEMRFFGGLGIEEIAEIEGVSPRTVKSDWRVARAWLHGEVERTK
jgi:RNA polymerase sigma-70 factor (ECF subfamily)